MENEDTLDNTPASDPFSFLEEVTPTEETIEPVEEEIPLEALSVLEEEVVPENPFDIVEPIDEEGFIYKTAKGLFNDIKGGIAAIGDENSPAKVGTSLAYDTLTAVGSKVYEIPSILASIDLAATAISDEVGAQLLGLTDEERAASDTALLNRKAAFKDKVDALNQEYLDYAKYLKEDKLGLVLSPEAQEATDVVGLVGAGIIGATRGGIFNPTKLRGRLNQAADDAIKGVLSEKAVSTQDRNFGSMVFDEDQMDDPAFYLLGATAEELVLATGADVALREAASLIKKGVAKFNEKKVVGSIPEPETPYDKGEFAPFEEVVDNEVVVLDSMMDKRDRTVDGALLPRKSTIYLNEMKWFEDVQRSKARADFNAGKITKQEMNERTRTTLYDPDIEAVRQLTEGGGAWSTRAIGANVRDDRVRNVFDLDSNGIMKENENVKNLSSIYSDAVDLSDAKTKDVEEFFQARNASDDYFNVDNLTHAKFMEMFEYLRKDPEFGSIPTRGQGPTASLRGTEVVKEGDTRLDSITTFSKQNVWTEVENYVKDVREVLIADKAKGGKLTPEFDNALKKAEQTQKRLKKIVKDPEFTSILDEALNTATVKPYLSRAEVNTTLDKYVDTPWAQQASNDLNKFNEWILKQRMLSGDISPDKMTEWLMAKPGYVPSYKEREILSTVMENQNVGNGNLYNRRDISVRPDKGALQNQIQYVNGVEKIMVKNYMSQRAVSYLTRTLDDTSWDMVFTEPRRNVANVINNPGNKNSFSRNEISPIDQGGALQSVDTVNFKIKGVEYNLGIKDKELYGVLSRHAHLYQGGMPETIQKGFDLFRYVITHNPAFAAKVSVREWMDKLMLSDLPVQQRLQVKDTLRNIRARELDVKDYETFVTNYGYINRLPQMERNRATSEATHIADILDDTSKSIAKKLKDGTKEGLSQLVFRADMMHRYTYYKALKETGMSEAQAVSKARNMTVRYSQRGIGMNKEANDRLLFALKSDLEEAIRSKDKKQIKVAYKALASMGGWRAVTRHPVKTMANAVVKTPALANHMYAAPFMRTYVNSLSRLTSRMRYETAAAATGITYGVAMELGFQAATDPSEIFSPNTTDQEDLLNWRLQWGNESDQYATIPRGYTGALNNLLKNSVASAASFMYNDVLPDRLHDKLNEMDPELASAMGDYSSRRELTKAVVLTAGAFFDPSNAPKFPGVAPVVEVITNKDRFNRPIVPPHIESSGIEAVKTNDRTSHGLNQFAQYLEQKTGRSFSPAQAQHLINGFLPVVGDAVLNATDIALSNTGKIPTKPAKTTGELPLFGWLSGKELVAPDERLVSAKYFNVLRTSKEAYYNIEEAKEHYEAGLVDAEFKNAIDTENRALADIYTLIKADNKAITDMYKEKSAITHSKDSIYEADPTIPIINTSPSKRDALREIRKSQYDIMSQVLKTVGEIDEGKKLIDSTGNYSGITKFLINSEDALISPLNLIKGSSEFFDPNNTVSSTDVEFNIDPNTDGGLKQPTDSTIESIWNILSPADTVDEGAALVPSDIQEAIDYASLRTNVRKDVLYAIANLESSFRPRPNDEGASTASGLFQFVDPTWKLVVDMWGDDYGITINDKDDLAAQSIMAAELIRDEHLYLKNYVLDRDPTFTETYLAHKLGRSDVRTFIEANASADRVLPADRLLPAAAKANKYIFYKPKKDDSGGETPDLKNPRTVKEVYALLDSKVTVAALQTSTEKRGPGRPRKEDR